MAKTQEPFGSLLQLNTAVLLVLPWCALYIIWTLFRSSRSSLRQLEQQRQLKTVEPDVYEDIRPVPDLEWRTTEPLKIRPFKSRYHLTMGLENLTFSDLIAMDKTYLDRVHIRRKVMDQHAEATLACNDAGIAAVLELHEWMFKTYLPQRFPTMFSTDKQSTTNLVTNEVTPVHESDPMTALRSLGSHVDTDFLFLLPSSVSNDGQPIYHLEAFVTCFPSGFSTQSKLSKPLAEIHKPVPGYAAKLERSMDRYFAKIAVGQIVRRANFTITTDDDLFIQAGTHLYGDDDPAVREMIEKQRQEIVIDNCRLRTERQTLHRLPKSRALVFAFKTYQYRLEDVKAEGNGPALADAIEGLAKGSVPEMHFYKRAVVWGDTVAQYLRA